MIRYALLGLIQGLTEFLPVSSSGHLVIVERLVALDPPGILLEAFLHLGTLGAVLWVFRSDIAELALAFSRRGSIERRKEIGFLLTGTIPIVVVGLLFQRVAETVFSSLTIVGVGLLFTALALAAAGRLHRRAKRRQLRFADSLAIGLAQALALVPGVSRSGVTIAAGIVRRVDPERAARFSFLLSIPALIGAGLLSLWSVAADGGWGGDWWGIIVGTLVAFAVGILGIRALLAFVRHARLWIFAIYCGCIGLSVLILDLI